MAASAGDAEAQFELGNFFTSKNASHKKEPSDAKTAFAWYHKAATQGHGDAQYRLALAYADGVGVGRDSVLAASWFNKAAQQGNAWAQFRMGLCFKNGEGVSAHLETAIYWFQQAADRDHGQARLLLETAKRALRQRGQEPGQIGRASCRERG